jgi:hypothetical protein
MDSGFVISLSIVDLMVSNIRLLALLTRRQ